MYESTTLFAFAVASLVLVLLPGPNSLFILGAGISGGRRHALAAAVGVELGTMVHVLAAALGLSALLQSSAVAFSTIKYLGVAYLVYLGVRALRSKPDELSEPAHGSRSALASMRNGTLVNVLNPKVSLFFLAFLPQFIRMDRPALPQYLIFTATIVIVDIILMWGVFAGAARPFRRLTSTPRGRRTINCVFGALFIVVAGLLLLMH